MGNQQTKGHHIWPTSCMPGIARELHSDNSIDQDDDTTEEDEAYPISPTELENAISNEDGEQLEALIKAGADINMPLNEDGNTPLIMSVKLKCLKLVQRLLTYKQCKKNCLNANNCSALDIALLTAFDSQNEPSYNASWHIIECLMKANSQPVCKDAMMHVVRTAFKYSNEDFLYKLIQVSLECSNSSKLHELLLLKILRHQPIYSYSIDPLLISVSDYSVKLLKNTPRSHLEFVVNSLVHYLDCYWDSKQNKFKTIHKLILYATGRGWRWSSQQISHINQVNAAFARWCAQQVSDAPSLCHLSRVAFSKSLPCDCGTAVNNLNYRLPLALKNYLLLKDIDQFVQTETPLKDIVL